MRSVQGLQDRALLELSRLGFQGLECSDDEEDSALRRSVKGKPTQSGLEAKVLDYVLYPQVLPHMKLQFEYCGRDILSLSDIGSNSGPSRSVLVMLSW